jgi:hypothetical protein
LERDGVLRRVRQHQLQREVAIRRLVARAPHRAHRAMADEAHEAVPTSNEIAGLERESAHDPPG